MVFRRHVTTALTATAPSTAGLTGSRSAGVRGSCPDTCVPDRQRDMRSAAVSLLRASLLIVWALLDVSGYRLVLASGWHGALCRPFWEQAGPCSIPNLCKCRS
jgi:hypothetical protein